MVASPHWKFSMFRTVPLLASAFSVLATGAGSESTLGWAARQNERATVAAANNNEHRIELNYRSIQNFQTQLLRMPPAPGPKSERIPTDPSLTSPSRPLFVPAAVSCLYLW